MPERIYSNCRPDFMIIGAMKCATSTLHEQLALQDDFFMSTPKEPNFFSDDDVFAKGRQWYEDLFQSAGPGQLRGESSTHYTKLPIYPHTVERIRAWYPQMKFIYVMRHPVDRLISHYIHEWTQGMISTDIDTAVRQHPELISYGCYAMQLTPYFDAFGASSVLPVFAERLREDPVRELQGIFKFLGVERTPVWNHDLRSNVSSERIRVCGWRDALVNMPVLREVRRVIVPKKVRDWVKGFWRMKERPVLGRESLQYVERQFDRDLKQLGDLLGLELNCRNFKEIVLSAQHVGWS